MNRLNQEALECQKLWNDYQLLINAVKNKIKGKDGEIKANNLYAIYEDDVMEMIAGWESWFRENKDADCATLRERIANMEKEEELKMAELKKDFEEAEQRRAEEERRAEEKRRAEERRRAEEERQRQQRAEEELVRRWVRLNSEVEVATKHLTDADLTFLVLNRAR